MRVNFEKGIDIVTYIFSQAGMPEKPARRLARLFITTEGKGVYSHGVNLVLKYVERILDGTISMEPNISVVTDYAAVGTLDGDAGLGVVVLEDALVFAVGKARKYGVAAVTVTNLQHYAAGLYYIDKPVQEGMIVSIIANSPPSIAPYGGPRKYLGTNPLTFAAPMGHLPPYCLDMASSVCAGNKLENARNLGQKVAFGIGLDREGNPSDDPTEILSKGSLLPFGGAKGSGIAGMINILSGIMGTAAYRDDVISLCRDVRRPANYGCFISVIDISKFMRYEDYCFRAETWANEILEMPAARGFDQVVYPGYLEGMRLTKAKQEGLELSQISMQNLCKAGEKLEIDVMALLGDASVGK